MLLTLLDCFYQHNSFPAHKVYGRRQKEYSDTIPRSAHNSGTFSGTSSSGTSGSKAKEELKNRPLSFGDARVFFPESFVIPRQRCDQDRVVIKNVYSIRKFILFIDFTSLYIKI